MKKIYVIHENDAWVDPLRAAFAELDLPYSEWFLNEGVLDFSSAPPEGVFYNRMSASSHTRGTATRRNTPPQFSLGSSSMIAAWSTTAARCNWS